MIPLIFCFCFSANNTPPEAVPEGVQDAYLTAESLRRGLVCVILNTFSHPVVPHFCWKSRLDLKQ